jgi:hypothetical protein
VRKQPAVVRRDMSFDSSGVYDFDTRHDASQRTSRLCASRGLRQPSRRFDLQSPFEAVKSLLLGKRPG